MTNPRCPSIAIGRVPFEKVLMTAPSLTFGFHCPALSQVAFAPATKMELQSVDLQQAGLYDLPLFDESVDEVKDGALLASHSLPSVSEDSDGASSTDYGPSSSVASTSVSTSSSAAGSPLCSPNVTPDRAQPIDAEDACFFLDTLKSRRSKYAADLVRKEAQALLVLANRLEHKQEDEADSLSDAFSKALNLLSSMDKHGKLIFTGIGKSGLLAKKAVATFNSLGKLLRPVKIAARG